MVATIVELTMVEKRNFLIFAIRELKYMLARKRITRFNTFMRNYAICLLMDNWKRMTGDEFRLSENDYLNVTSNRFSELGKIIREKLDAQEHWSMYLMWDGNIRLQVEKRLSLVNDLKVKMFPKK